MHQRIPGGLLLRALALGVAVWLSGCRADDGRESSRPNVMVVTFDALRADRLGVYGYEKNTSPRLDAFARRSTVFLDAMSQSGSTVPSFASLWTGKFPFVDGVVQTRPDLTLGPSAPVLAEVLQAEGYNTAAVIGHRYAGSRFGFARGFDMFDDDCTSHEPPDRTLDRTLAMLEKLSSPFFLWVHFKQPHSPYEPSKELFREFYDGPLDEPLIVDVGRDEALHYYSRREPVTSYALSGKWRDLTPTMLNQYRALYDGNIRRADEAFGKLLSHLEATGAAGETVTMVASDHGEGMGENNWFEHNHVYYGIIRTPIIVHLPGRKPEVLSYPVMNIDIFPTVLQLAGVGFDGPLRGCDLFDADREDYFQYAEFEDRMALKKGAHKLYVRWQEPGPKVRLYDVRADPDEQTDLTESMPELTAELKSKLDSLSRLQEHSETMERLKALGYIE